MTNFFAKPIVAVLAADTKLQGGIIDLLKEHLGPADFVGPWHPFEHTKYYAPEMGSVLKRCIISFGKPVSPDELPKIKSLTKEIEDEFRVDGKRKVNLDPGYVDYHKVVLASGKGGGHMVMLARGVYADVLLWYNKGWQPLPWAYPDFRDGTYFDELNRIRSLLKQSASMSHK